jgi:HK97 family phage prohead protease
METPLEFKFELKELGPTGEIEGWASTFDLDLGRDKVLPGAFASTIRKSKGEVPMLMNHDRDKIVGVGTAAQEDNRGLYVKAKLAMGTQLGREVWELMSMGALKGLSIGYTIPDNGSVMDGNVRLLKAINLHEYSATPFPMNPQAQVARVKAITELSAREVEDQLRDVFGLSQREAKAVISEGFRNLISKGTRDVAQEQETEEKARTLLAEMRGDMAARSMLASMLVL